jgi:NAD+ diphosphatase
MSAAPLDPGRLALGRVGVDRRADLRAAGWAAVPGRRRIVLLDETGEAAVRFAAERSATLVTLDVDAGGQPTPAVARTQAGGRTDAPNEDVFLGLASDGVALCGRVVGRGDPLVPAGAQWASLRSVGLALPDEERAVLAEFLALANWHRTHHRCPRCGGPTRMAGLGWWRTCPQDSSEHYPRTDPAVIAVLVDSEGNALLGRQVRWPVGAYSTLAGFVEPGESAEAAVVREITEEVGLRPDTVTYVASQPWPFPASLMLGFRATIDAVRPEPRVDGTEIVEARWISRSDLPALCEAREVRLPGRLSIAHHLVRGWFGADLPDAWCRW